MGPTSNSPIGTLGGQGPQGTLGGVKSAIGTPPGRTPVRLGDEVYLWALVAIEVGAIAWLRNAFKRHHGG
jgi:hypothetical protein